MSGAPARIGPGTRVELAYRLLDEEGNLMESSDEEGPMDFELGAGEIFPALERALIGLTEGDERTVVLEAAEAFGPIDPEAIIAVPLDVLPEGEVPKVGDLVPLILEPEDDAEAGAAGEEPEEIEALVREVNADGIVLDTNHPLAGHALTFEIVVLRVRG